MSAFGGKADIPVGLLTHIDPRTNLVHRVASDSEGGPSCSLSDPQRFHARVPICSVRRRLLIQSALTSKLSMRGLKPVQSIGRYSVVVGFQNTNYKEQHS